MQLGKSKQPKHKPKTQGKTQIPQPDLRLTIRKTAKQTANGARANKKKSGSQNSNTSILLELTTNDVLLGLMLFCFNFNGLDLEEESKCIGPVLTFFPSNAVWLPPGRSTCF